MQAIIFIGIQASGKSTYYQAHFFNSHVRISRDLLNTKNKENKFLETCYATYARLVIDNTNPTVADRARYISVAKANKYEVVGYYFSAVLEEALMRNNKRTGKEKIPEVGIKGCYNKLVLPQYHEGFDSIYYVKLTEKGFVTKDWQDEV